LELQTRIDRLEIELRDAQEQQVIVCSHVLVFINIIHVYARQSSSSAHLCDVISAAWFPTHRLPQMVCRSLVNTRLSDCTMLWWCMRLSFPSKQSTLSILSSRRRASLSEFYSPFNNETLPPKQVVGLHLLPHPLPGRRRRRRSQVAAFRAIHLRSSFSCFSSPSAFVCSLL
jgi:hypothetical protein